MFSLRNIWVFLLISISHQNPVVLNTWSSFQTQVQGSRLFLNCLPILGDSPFSFNWMKNGREIHENDHVQIRKDNLMSILLIENLTSDDSGNYTCSVYNQGGFDSQSSYLSVQGV